MEILQMNKLLVHATGGIFIAKLLDCLLTKEEMQLMSKTGGTCRGNKNRDVNIKIGIPEHISNAVVGI